MLLLAFVRSATGLASAVQKQDEAHEPECPHACPWNLECEVCSVKYGVYSVDCQVWRAKCGVLSVECNVWSVKWEVWSVKCGVGSVKRRV